MATEKSIPNSAVTVIKKNWKKILSSLDGKSITDNKKFCRTDKLFLSEKTPFNEKRH